jgi:type II secretory pathway predicted ATPase ExeA
MLGLDRGHPRLGVAETKTLLRLLVGRVERGSGPEEVVLQGHSLHVCRDSEAHGLRALPGGRRRCVIGVGGDDARDLFGRHAGLGM